MFGRGDGSNIAIGDGTDLSLSRTAVALTLRDGRWWCRNAMERRSVRRTISLRPVAHAVETTLFEQETHQATDMSVFVPSARGAIEIHLLVDEPTDRVQPSTTPERTEVGDLWELDDLAVNRRVALAAVFFHRLRRPALRADPPGDETWIDEALQRRRGQYVLGAAGTSVPTIASRKSAENQVSALVKEVAPNRGRRRRGVREGLVDWLVTSGRLSRNDALLLPADLHLRSLFEPYELHCLLAAGDPAVAAALARRGFDGHLVARVAAGIIAAATPVWRIARAAGLIVNDVANPSGTHLLAGLGAPDGMIAHQAAAVRTWVLNQVVLHPA